MQLLGLPEELLEPILQYCVPEGSLQSRDESANILRMSLVCRMLLPAIGSSPLISGSGIAIPLILMCPLS